MNDMNDIDDMPAVITDAGGDRIRASLVRAVEAASGAPWDVARRRWDVTAIDHDPTCAGVCVCGQTGLARLYTIADRVNGAALYPIGSDCIAHFDVDAMTDRAKDLRCVADLRGIVARGVRLELRGPGKHFTQRALLALYNDGAFRPSRFNGGDPGNDYEFMLSMFRKRNDPSAAQERKVAALLATIAAHVRTAPPATGIGGAA